MSHTSMILSGLLLVAVIIFFAPNIIALNRGRVMRNIALWLAIFLALALIYQNFGPGSDHPLFELPDAMKAMDKDATAPPAEPSDANSGETGYTPPKE